ncbi:hypothetical protein BH09MYX1_BH09MYX1_54000 [soil metagenome]
MHAKCTRCSKAFCDPCLGFTVNGVPWCEPCGNRAEEESRPQWVAGILLGGGIFGAATVLFVALWIAAGRIYPWLMVALWGGAIVTGWNRVSPLRGSERPVVERRRRER